MVMSGAMKSLQAALGISLSVATQLAKHSKADTAAEDGCARGNPEFFAERGRRLVKDKHSQDSDYREGHD